MGWKFWKVKATENDTLEYKYSTKNYNVNKGALVCLYDNVRMAHELKYKLPSNYTSVKYGTYEFNNNVNVPYEKVVIRIGRAYSAFSRQWYINFFVQGIKVYDNEDGWLHDVPEKMKEYIVGIINNEISIYNRECNDQKLSESYDLLQKQKELVKQQKEIENHENEKKKLLEIFK